MLIDLNGMEERKLPCMNNGTGEMSVKMYAGSGLRVISCRIHKGGSIGCHTQQNGDDINYVLSGVGKAICDGVEEPLTAGNCHVCPKGSEHSIINTGDEDLVLLTVVVQR